MIAKKRIFEVYFQSARLFPSISNIDIIVFGNKMQNCEYSYYNSFIQYATKIEIQSKIRYKKRRIFD